MRNIRGIDLELLLTLEALLTECNVTRVAQRLHLSQPTVSVRLGKLRRLFADPLLVSGPRGMRPTARGLELLAPLRDALSGVERMLSAQTPFDPASSDLTWRVAASDYAQCAILMPLLTHLRRHAPGIRSAVHPLIPAEVARMAERGDIDAAFSTTDTVPESLRSVTLFAESYQFIARKHHPLLKGTPTLAQFCALDHVLVSPTGGGFKGPTDVLLEARRRKRRVVLSVPHFLLVPDLVRQSDMVAMLPARLLKGHSQGLQLLDSPIQPPGYDMAMSWHERVHADTAHAWLREQVIQAVTQAATPSARP
ncbi:LysR family transcriptional regulator [Dyella silvatica]|uniref:LysR family transcriptional regulator n=1 Tax=Dyella silvatica TaxID=2992128 RepID=UPI0022561982|nr:LysR family transcriptional regulator [Dyella silvatica]